ncbi:hypothetical protein NESM_000826100 [Novymonas esmeraldas]|uniref:Uncharacterized protein n=1 Tax=Novymonas esmeraldas TaxID=1808958 RepID=A0AAW0F036_9TRYP
MQALPHVLADRRQRLQVQESTVVQDAALRMSAAVQQLHTCSSDIRQCSGVIEGTVLMLGVRTAHTLLTQLGRALEAIDGVVDAWRTTASTQAEHCAQYRQLMASMDQVHAGMKERREAVEKELRALRVERDRKEAAYDAAVLYVQRVLAEHTAWQEAHGHNTQSWPTTTACDEAMSALHAARAGTAGAATASAVVVVGGGGADRRGRRDVEETAMVLAQEDDFTGGGGGPPPPQPSPPPPLREWAPATATATAAAGVSSTLSAEDSGDVALRWRAVVAGRIGATQPSVRFAYVPPAEEVELLREVLAMGTGSTTLVKDINAAHARLDEHRAHVLALCVRSLGALHATRQELRTMKTHLRQLMDRHAPFASMADELVDRIQQHVEAEVKRRLAAAAATTTTAAAAVPNISTAAPSLVGGSYSGRDTRASRTSASSASFAAAQSSDYMVPACSSGWAWPPDA